MADAALTGFPQHVVRPGATLYRIHGNKFGPWFFRTDGNFRFDLVDSAGWGTCYFAEDPVGAFVEALQGFRAVTLPRGELTARRLFEYRVRHALVLADVTTQVAASWGFDASISASTPLDYDASQRFAAQAYRAGFAGIRYRTRHDIEQDHHSVALFGPAGPQPDDLLEGTASNLDEPLLARACEEMFFRARGPLLDP